MLTDGMKAVLEFTRNAAPMIGWTISPDWAQAFVEHFELEFDLKAGGVTGEKHALFEYEGSALRLQLEFPNRWKLYHGPWKRDPAWTGD